MNLTKIRNLVKANEDLSMKDEKVGKSLQIICIESKKSTNKLKASIMEGKLNIALENEVGTVIESYESPIVDSDDLVGKIKDAINLYDMIDTLNIEFSDGTEQEINTDDIENVDVDIDGDGEEDLEVDIQDTELTDAETGKEVTDTNADTEIDDSEPRDDFDGDGEEETLLNEETPEEPEPAIDGTDGEDIVVEEDEDLDSIEVNEDVSTQSKLTNVQDEIVAISKKLTDIAENCNDVEIMSIIMDLANSLSSDALDIEEAIETINELDTDEDLEEVEECDKTESMLLRFRNSITESKLLAKKIKNTNDADKEIFEKYINTVDEIL